MRSITIFLALLSMALALPSNVSVTPGTDTASSLSGGSDGKGDPGSDKGDPYCHDYVLLEARATFEKQGPSAGFIGMVASTLSKVPNGIEYDTVYPADISFKSADIGVADMTKYLQTNAKRCPKQKYALLGYSQGAGVVVLTAKAIEGTPLARLIFAIITLGNPYQKPGEIVTTDEKGLAKTRDGLGILFKWHPDYWFSEWWIKSGKVLNICFEADLICDWFKLWPWDFKKPWELLSKTHLLYGKTASVQEQGAQWLISHLKQGGDGKGGNEGGGKGDQGQGDSP